MDGITGTRGGFVIIMVCFSRSPARLQPPYQGLGKWRTKFSPELGLLALGD